MNGYPVTALVEVRAPIGPLGFTVCCARAALLCCVVLIGLSKDSLSAVSALPLIVFPPSLAASLLPLARLSAATDGADNAKGKGTSRTPSTQRSSEADQKEEQSSDGEANNKNERITAKQIQLDGTIELQTPNIAK